MPMLVVQLFERLAKFGGMGAAGGLCWGVSRLVVLGAGSDMGSRPMRCVHIT
jgi:hypothetical protein